jgi:hypothetical protein
VLKKENHLNKRFRTKNIVTEKTNDTFEVLILKDYRDQGEENEVNGLTKNWLDLYKKEWKYYLGKADYNIVRGFQNAPEILQRLLILKTILFY